MLLNLFLAILLDGFAEKLNEKDALVLHDESFDDRPSKFANDFKVIIAKTIKYF